MKRGYVALLLFFSLHAQQHDRVIGALVNKIDRESWQRITNPTDIAKQDLVAAYCFQHKEWLYAEVIIAPGNNFAGLASFVKDGLHYNFFALDFKKNARKLLTKDEIQLKLQTDSDHCSLH
jgi:hypothetical protein